MALSNEPLVIGVPDELIERIAERAAEIVRQGVPGRDPADHLRSGGWEGSPYLSVPEAADYLRAKPQRIYDLLSSRRLTRLKDGKRVLVSRSELDAYLAGNGLSRVAPTLPRPPRNPLTKGLAG